MKRIGLVVAMASELNAFLTRLGKEKQRIQKKGFCVYVYEAFGKELYVTDSGVGEVSSAIATQRLVDCFNIEGVINFGVCGSLDSELDVSEIVLGEAVYHFDRDTSRLDGCEVGYYTEYESKYLKADEKLLSLAKTALGGIRSVVIASSEKFVADSALKSALQKEGAKVCEMEALGVLLASYKNDIPCLLVKAVSDKADEEAKMSFSEMLTVAMQRLSDLLIELIQKI